MPLLDVNAGTGQLRGDVGGLFPGSATAGAVRSSSGSPYRATTRVAPSTKARPPSPSRITAAGNSTCSGLVASLAGGVAAVNGQVEI